MNNLVTYGQTFSKGQLTIPKKFRDFHGLGDNFAYKMTHQEDKIIIEPQDNPKKKMSKAEYIKFVTTADTSWYTENDYQDYLKMRKQLAQRPTW